MDAWTASNSLVYNPKNMYGKFKYTDKLITPTLRLEHIRNTIPENTAIDLIKIDVQGVNINVLRSAGDALLRARSVSARGNQPWQAGLVTELILGCQVLWQRQRRL
jgi:hypothetical protein